MLRQFVARTEMLVKSKVLPRSLRSVADLRAARTEEKVGHSGRDDTKTAAGRDAKSHRAPLLGVAGWPCAHPGSRVRDCDAYSGVEVQRMPNETVGL
jgi:hypothetical protein